MLTHRCFITAALVFLVPLRMIEENQRDGVIEFGDEAVAGSAVDQAMQMRVQKRELVIVGLDRLQKLKMLRPPPLLVF